MQSVNTKIIKEIIRQSPGNKSPVKYLTKMFSMSKETAYRRIRSQIPFSIEELVVIAKDFNLSIDKLLDLNSDGNNLLLNSNFNIEQEPAEVYTGLLRNNIEIMEKLLASTNLKATIVINSISFQFLPYKLLFKLDYCHYLHSVGKMSLVTTRYSDIEVPPVINDLQEKSVDCFRRLNNVTCIIDGMLFSNIIKKIQYYYQLKCISAEDLQLMQSELFKLLEAYEKLLNNGKNSAGSDCTFYYSVFNLESNIAFFEYDDNSLLQVWVYPENPIVVRDNDQINNIQKRWINSKIRNSILITKTTDIHQIKMLRNMNQQILDLTKGYPVFT